MPRKPGDAKVSLTQEQKNALIEADDYMNALDGTGIERYTPAELKTIQADLYQRLLLLFPGPQEQRLVTWNVRRPNGERLPPWLKAHRLSRPAVVPKQAPPPCRRPAGPSDSLESGASRRRARMALMAQQQRQTQLERIHKDLQKADINATAVSILVAPVTSSKPVPSPPPVLSSTAAGPTGVGSEKSAISEASVRAFMKRMGGDVTVPLTEAFSSMTVQPPATGPFPFMLLVTDVDSADPCLRNLVPSPTPFTDSGAAPMELTV